MAQPTIPFPKTNGTVMLPGPAGALEVSVEPAEPGEARAGNAILCHPHPMEGGPMQNKVVTKGASSLR